MLPVTESPDIPWLWVWGNMPKLLSMRTWDPICLGVWGWDSSIILLSCHQSFIFSPQTHPNATVEAKIHIWHYRRHRFRRWSCHAFPVGTVTHFATAEPARLQRRSAWRLSTHISLNVLECAWCPWRSKFGWLKRTANVYTSFIIVHIGFWDDGWT